MLMFETAELGQKIDKQTYKDLAPVVRTALLEAQRKVAGSDFSVVVMIDGMEGAGKSETVNLLLEWLDVRGIQTHAMGKPTEEERDRPPAWRYWHRLPPKGHMAIFFGAWDKTLINERVFGRISEAEFDQALDRMLEIEQMLAQENVLLVKFWLHLSKRGQKRKLQALQDDPCTSWRVGKHEWKLYRKHDEVRSVAEHYVRRTNTIYGQWHIIEGENKRYRNLTVAQRLLDALQTRLAIAKSEPPRPAPQPNLSTPPEINILSQLDLSQKVEDKGEYGEELAELQGRLGDLTHRLQEERRSMMLVFEGPDAAGKGGAIRRVTQAMDARDYQVIAVGAPTDEELARPYLWRFWRHLPRLGKATIYDRSWYGRVLVERVEGLATEREWQRAYNEINSFEQQLADFGIILQKFWLHISHEEQLTRFQDRQVTPFKQYKITPDDWRNRAKWDSYLAAACEMIEQTSTEAAPWTLIEANDKKFARIRVLRTIVKRIEKAFKEEDA
jgi:polyphosphate:AMP phosphotransferase